MNRAAYLIILVIMLHWTPWSAAADSDAPRQEDEPVDVKSLEEAEALPPETQSVHVNYRFGLRKGGQFTQIMKTLARHPGIRHLSLELPNSTHVRDNALDVLAEFPSLESLDLRDARDWEPDEFYQQIAAMKKLKHASLEFFCRSPSMEKCEAAMKAMPHLESVMFTDGRDHTKRTWETALNERARELLALRAVQREDAPPRRRDEPIVPGIRTTPFVIGNRDDPTDTQLSAFSKIFCVALRKLNGDSSKRHALRVFIDPRYLEKHGLTEGDLAMKMILVGNVFSLDIADDRRTVACEVSTSENERELILLKLTVHEGALYLAPGAPPDETTKEFSPWILRKTLKAKDNKR